MRIAVIVVIEHIALSQRRHSCRLMAVLLLTAERESIDAALGQSFATERISTEARSDELIEFDSLR